MDCTDCLNMWEVATALSIGVMSGVSLIFALKYWSDVTRDKLIMELQRTWAERNKLQKKLRELVQD